MLGFFVAPLFATPVFQPSPAPTVWILDEADDAYAFIAGLADKELHDVVVREATRFLERYGKHGRADDVRYALAGAHFELDQLEKARPLYARLVKADGFGFPDEVRFRLGQCELERGQLEAAVAALESVGEGYLQVPALYLAGEAFFQGERFEEAAQRFEAVRSAERRAAQQGEGSTGTYGSDALHGLAWCALRLEQPDPAVEAATRFLTDYPADERGAEMRFLAAEAHRSAERYPEALAFYGAVEREGAEGAERWREASLRGAAFAAAASGETENAAERFRILLERFPDGRYAAEAALQRGVNLVLAERPSMARAALEDGRVPAGPTADYWRGRAALADGDPEAAEKVLRRGLESDPEPELLAELASSRGDALFELSRTAEAAQSYELSATPYSLHAGAVAHLNDGRAEQAERLARALLAQVEAGAGGAAAFDVEGRMVLAEALFARGAYGDAEPLFGGVAEEAGDGARSSRALVRAGWCLYLTEDWGGAQGRFRLLLERFPEGADAPEAGFLAARCAEELGETDSAVARYDDYVQRFPGGELRPEALLRSARLVPGEGGEARLAKLLSDHSDAALAPDAAVELGDRRAAAGRLEEAAGAYVFAIERAPDSELVHPARYGLGWARYGMGDGAGALEPLAELVRAPGAPAELLLAAQELRIFAARTAARPKVALEALGGFVPLCSDEGRRVAAGEVVAETLVTAGQAEQASSVYGALAQGLSDPAAVARLAVARTYLALDGERVEDAEQQLRVALGAAPQDGAALEAAFFVGEARFTELNDAAAVAAYDLAAASADPEVASRALYKAGFARLRSANSLVSPVETEEGVETGEAPSSEALAQRQEQAYGLWGDAGQDFAALVAGYQDSALYGEGLYLAGECAYRRGELQPTREWMTRLLEERPQHATRSKALFRLGLSQAKMGAFLEASRNLAALRKESPEFEGILEAELWRGKSLFELQDMRAATQALERVCAEDRGVLSAQAYLTLGQVAQVSSDLDEALSQFLKVAVLYALDEEVAEALYRAGQVLEAKEDSERARAQYADAAKRFPATPFGERAAVRLTELSR